MRMRPELAQRPKFFFIAPILVRSTNLSAVRAPPINCHTIVTEIVATSPEENRRPRWQIQFDADFDCDGRMASPSERRGQHTDRAGAKRGNPGGRNPVRFAGRISIHHGSDLSRLALGAAEPARDFTPN